MRDGLPRTHAFYKYYYFGKLLMKRSVKISRTRLFEDIRFQVR